MCDVKPVIADYGFKSKLCKQLTVFLFYLLPKKFTEIFINLSILAAIYNIQNKDFCQDRVNYRLMHKLLKVSIDDKILLLPNYTVKWFWREDFFNTPVTINNKEYLFREVIENDAMLFHHPKLVIDLFINNTPRLLTRKLKLHKTEERVHLKHNVMTVLMHT